jgi:heme/copper-type cytochrome/quinol oxidase subunit 1
MPPLVDFLVVVMSLAFTGAGLFALVDAVRRPQSGFEYIGKLSKPIWLVILAVATVFVLVAPISILGLAGMVGIGVYYADMRPKLQELSR